MSMVTYIQTINSLYYGDSVESKGEAQYEVAATEYLSSSMLQ